MVTYLATPTIWKTPNNKEEHWKGLSQSQNTSQKLGTENDFIFPQESLEDLLIGHMVHLIPVLKALDIQTGKNQKERKYHWEARNNLFLTKSKKGKAKGLKEAKSLSVSYQSDCCSEGWIQMTNKE